MQTVFENPLVIIVDKPANTLSIPGRTGKEDPRRCIATELGNRFDRLFPVHRLDFEVSGVLIFAKTAEAHRLLNGWFETHALQKYYSALSDTGAFAVGDSFEWKSKLVRGKKRAFERPYGKDSLTKSKVIAVNSHFTQWELEPLTGRSHQLRFEMAKFGYPIWGDVLYGGKPTNEGIALRAVRVDFSRCSNRESLELPERIDLGGDDLLNLFGQNSVAK